MPVAAPPRPPGSPRGSDPIDREELESLVEALIEEARRRARRRRRVVASVAALVALVGLGTFAILERAAQSQTSPSTSAPRALAAVGPPATKIAYTRDSDGWKWQEHAAEAWVMNIDGSRQQRLTSRTGFASWSPNGRRLAFGSGDGYLYVMDADGRNERRLTRGGSPTWSPDGRRIAFLGWRANNVDVYVVNADETGQRRLTSSPGDDVGPTWSPDSRTIAFLSARGGDAETAATARWDRHLEVYVMNADGSAQRRLTDSPGDEGWPTWSPDGRRIAFVRTGANCSTSCSRLYVMDADGSRQRRLTRGNDSMPAWSPDGRRIAFLRGSADAHVYVVGADGSGVRKLAQSRLNFQTPVWSPDGRRIAFSREDGRQHKGFPGGYPFTTNREIYAVNPDGTGLRNLTRSPADELAPVWLRR